MPLAIIIAVSYLVGSIPTGLLLGKMYGIDVRKEGSGNIGATNLYRTVGRKVGVITLIGDCIKGVVPVLVVKLSRMPFSYICSAAVAVFCGHVFSIFLKFKGGKGVATALGVFIVLAPLPLLAALLLFIILVYLFRFVSLGSIAAAAVMPVAVWFMGGVKELVATTACISALVIIRHIENIKRLLAGSENRFKG